jgi:hypothetical protein
VQELRQIAVPHKRANFHRHLTLAKTAEAGKARLAFTLLCVVTEQTLAAKEYELSSARVRYQKRKAAKQPPSGFFGGLFGAPFGHGTLPPIGQGAFSQGLLGPLPDDPTSESPLSSLGAVQRLFQNTPDKAGK